jgi:hypothetical protein
MDWQWKLLSRTQAREREKKSQRTVRVLERERENNTKQKPFRGLYKLSSGRVVAGVSQWEEQSGSGETTRASLKTPHSIAPYGVLTID